MRAQLRTLMEDRAAAWSQVQDIQARREAAGYQPTDEDGETYTRALDDVERLSQLIEVEERADRLEAAMNRPAGDQRATAPQQPDADRPDADEQYRAVFEHFVRSGAMDLTTEERQLLAARMVSDPEVRAQAAGTSAAGGYTVPQEFDDRLVETLKAFGGLLNVADVQTTETGADILWPTTDGTAVKGALLAESTQAAEQDETFGQAKIGAHMFTSKIIRASFQFLQDSAINPNAFLARRCGERIGRAVADYLVTGTGTGQPQGILVGLTKGITSGTASKVGYDDLVDLEHTIDPAYRIEGRQRYVLSDSALREIRKLKDGQNRPLWVPSMPGGIPQTINGHPYTVDNSFPAFAAEAKPIIFGDIATAYLVRKVRGATVLRLTERYADYLQVGFLGFQRLDALVQDANAAAVLTVKAAS